jgi:hypothetical protein
VGYRLLDAQDGVAAGAIDTGRLDRVRSPGGEALYYLATAALKPGTYNLELAAATSSGRTGSVESTVDAQLKPAGSLWLSDLLVSEPGRRDAGRVVSVDGRLLGRTARAALEVRGAAAAPSVQFELAAAGEEGPRLMAPATVRPRSEPGCYNAEAMLDLSSPEPGR